jgi:hypothetical protein
MNKIIDIADKCIGFSGSITLIRWLVYIIGVIVAINVFTVATVPLGIFGYILAAWLSWLSVAYWLWSISHLAALSVAGLWLTLGWTTSSAIKFSDNIFNDRFIVTDAMDDIENNAKGRIIQ